MRINTKEAGLDRAKARKIDNNTWRHTDAGGVEHIRLHHTDIITFLPGGKVRLDSGGYKTVTTKDRWNKNLPYRIYSNRGVLYVRGQGKEIPFEDGMVLPDAFDAPAKVSPDIAWKKKVQKLVAKLDKFDAFPEPQSGDCWGCLVRAKNGERPIGRDCVRSHVEEGYMHGALVLRAMEAANYGSLPYVVEMARRDWPRWRTQVKRNVRRFVCKEIGLAA